MKFILVHGSFATPQDAWFPWVKTELEKLGHTAISPQFPVDKWSDVVKVNPKDYHPKQNLDVWLKKFKEIDINKNEDLFLIGHSIGSLFILEALQNFNIKCSSSIFVAPFLRIEGVQEIIEIANRSFYDYQLNFEVIKNLVPKSTVIYSDNDPYVSEVKALEFSKNLNSKSVKLNGLGHMGIESNLTVFPELLVEINKQL